MIRFLHYPTAEKPFDYVASCTKLSPASHELESHMRDIKRTTIGVWQSPTINSVCSRYCESRLYAACLHGPRKKTLRQSLLEGQVDASKAHIENLE